MLTGTMLSILFRSTPVTLAGYCGYSLLLPTLFGLLASNPERFLDLQLEACRGERTTGPLILRRMAARAFSGGAGLARSVDLLLRGLW
jgi:hypothetical protein